MNASYRSYETGVRARYISGVTIGDHSHARNFTPIAMYDILVAFLPGSSVLCWTMDHLVS